MSSEDQSQQRQAPSRLHVFGVGLCPATLLFLIIAIPVLGWAAYFSGSQTISDPPNRDMWQHIAALRALMVDLADPSNPFVVSDETSRHFHPLWVALAVLSKALDLNIWQAVNVASFAAMICLAAGIFVFARVFFLTSWGAPLLLVALLFGWFVQPAHTGYQSYYTLLYGAAYPATFMIGFSFMLWAIVIRALHSLRAAIALIPLVALMFATHQLGAVVGLIGAGCFVLFWADVSIKARAISIGAMALGLLLSFLWPYHNPLTLVLQPGNSTWSGGPNFYDPYSLVFHLIPAALGVLGFRGARARPLLVVGIIYASIFVVGLTGLQLSGRFLMPLTLILHIGLALLLLQIFDRRHMPRLRRNALIAGGVVVVYIAAGVQTLMVHQHVVSIRVPDSYIYDAALELTLDLPDTQPIAAHDLTAWPIVANGQRVVSVPWPEPGIRDLAERQATTQALFNGELSGEDRRALAEEHGVEVLIGDLRVLRRATREALTDQAVRTQIHGALIRFDLFE